MMAAENSTEDRIIDAALDLAALNGWRGLGLREIAGAAGIGLADFYDAFPGKDAILAGYARRLDCATLLDVEAGEGADVEGESARDRLFDAVMRRLDLMEPHKAAIAAILHDVTRDPLWAVCHAAGFLRSIGLAARGHGSKRFAPAGRAPADRPRRHLSRCVAGLAAR
jgi:AcrR family transcriptional regulator